ncbi:MAG: alpha/beta fold hydrolase, partial [Nitrososphaeraceae archaeon]
MMFSRDNHKFHTSPHVTAITLLLIGIIITSGTLFAFPLVLLNQNYAAIAQVQQHQQANGTSFQLGNTTFSHRLASVNGIQMHYVIGGHGPPVVLLHGWPET